MHVPVPVVDDLIVGGECLQSVEDVQPIMELVLGDRFGGKEITEPLMQDIARALHDELGYNADVRCENGGLVIEVEKNLH